MEVWAWLILWFIGSSAAASCPKLQLKENFSLNRFMGLWYMIQEQESIFQSIKSCNAATYELTGPSEAQVFARGLDSAGSPTTTRSILRIVDPSTPAHMVTDFVPGVEPPFDIVDTDYETFSCAHSCLSIMGIKTEFVFILSRDRVLDDKHVTHCRTIFESYGIDIADLVPTVQLNCSDHLEL